MLNSRQKGKRGEYQAVIFLNQILSTLATIDGRVFEITAKVHAQGADIYVPYPWDLNVEVKRGEVLLLGPWWKQTVRQAAGKTPVLMYRQNRKLWRFCIPASELVSGTSGYIEMGEEVFAAWLRNKSQK